MRNFAVISLSTLVVFGALGVIAVVQQRWTITLVLLFCSLTVIAILVLGSVRYLARLLRTVESKQRNDTTRLEELFAAADINEKKSVNVIQQTIEESKSETIEESKSEFQSQNELIQKLDDKIHRATRTTSSHVTASVRHSTNEIEALLQIFSKYNNLMLPMPSTGGWALDAQSLAHLLSVVEQRRPRLILELGSGTSSIWLGYLCRSYGGKLITLDHLEEYLSQTQNEVKRHNLEEFVECRLAPLEEVTLSDNVYSWYDSKSFSDLSNIDLLLVDGPPANTGPKARYPAVAKVFDKLSSEALVVLDDAHRTDELDIVNQWLSEYPELSQISIGTPRLACLRREA